MVREFVVSSPSYEAEVWYYGETKVKGYQMVIRVGVVQEKRALELFVASTALEPVTGLIAEFRRELDRIVKEDYPPGTVMTINYDKGIEKELKGRILLLNKEEGNKSEGQLPNDDVNAGNEMDSR